MTAESQARPSRSITVPDGWLAGTVGGLIVILFFLGVDLSQGAALRTPTFLTGAVFGSDGPPGTLLVVAFTLLHLAAFGLVGIAAVLMCRWAGLPHNLLLGAVYGLLLCTLLFYVSLAVTGTEVFLAEQWPAVLAGNLLAGLGMEAVLRARGPDPGVFGVLEQLRMHRTVREGLLAGLLGALIVAVWFLVVDLVAREPLFTPAALGSALLAGASGLAEVRIEAGTVLGYTAIHVSAFVLVGMLVAGLLAQAEKFPPLIWALLLLAVIFEVLFVGLVAMLGMWILAEIAWWSVLAGNLLAGAGMGGYLWRAHPALRRQLAAGRLWGVEDVDRAGGGLKTPG